MSLLRSLERALVGLGVLALAFFGAAHLDRALSSRAALAEVDTGAWSAQRRAAYREAEGQPHVPPLGALRIPRIGLEVPVFEGIDELTLNRGAGRIPGTARPGEGGNVALAGHRDGFFRGLKDIAQGDVLELRTGEGTRTYVVDRVVIVDPGDVSVLDDRGAPTLTLVTCYPFYYVGHAPQRWVVQGSLKAAEGSHREGESDARAGPRRIGDSRRVFDPPPGTGFGQGGSDKHGACSR